MEECKRAGEIDGIIEDFKTFRSETQIQLKNNVSFTMFWAVVVAFIGITSAVISNVYSQIDEFEKLANSEHKSLEVKVTDNSILQAKIETQLANIQKDLVDIKKSLSK